MFYHHAIQLNHSVFCPITILCCAITMSYCAITVPYYAIPKPRFEITVYYWAKSVLMSVIMEFCWAITVFYFNHSTPLRDQSAGKLPVVSLLCIINAIIMHL